MTGPRSSLRRPRRPTPILAIALGVTLTLIATPSSAHIAGSSGQAPNAPACGEASSALDGILPEPANGRAAVALLGANLPAVARLNCLTADELERTLKTDSTAWLDRNGRLYYVDARPAIAGAPQPAAPGPFPYAQTFQLHSRPGAPRVIFLDFDGFTIVGTAWNDGYDLPATDAAPFDTDGDPGTFSDDEQDTIQSVWQRVSEDFAPFDIDVTTEDPGTAAIERSSSGDSNYGTRALVTSDDFLIDAICGGGCGGIAYYQAFDAFGSGNDAHGYLQPALTFSPNGTGPGPNGIANTVSHEVGHNLNLRHDGTTTGDEYYSGHGAWSPLMGIGYTKSISQWSKGEYADANRTQDDLSVMQNNGAPLAVDDHTASGPVAAATPLVNGQGSGVIGTRTDVDWFTFDVGCAGTTTIDIYAGAIGAAATGPSPNLDVQFRLHDGAGFVATVDPASGQTGADQPFGLSTAYSAALAPGTYFIEISGVGFGDPLDTGYSDYGSVGRFAISASLPSSCGLANDAFSGAQLVSGTSATRSADSNVGATEEAGEPNHAGNAGGASIWYRWTPAASGPVTIDTAGSGFNTLLGVYTGSAVGSLTETAASDDVSGADQSSSVTFNATASTTYRIAVDGFDGATGAVVLHLNQTVSGSCSATVDVAVSGTSFTPKTAKPVVGGCIQWHFNGPGNHTATEKKQLGPGAGPLFDSGSKAPGSTFSYTFVASGSYNYRSTGDPSTMSGVVKVPVKLSAGSGGVSTSITVTWASASTAGYRSDVQMRFKPPGGSYGAWGNWRSDQTGVSDTFLASAANGKGIYQFRAHFENATTAKVSGWSAGVTLKIT